MRLALVILCALAAPAAAADDWKKFAAEKCGSSATMPGTPAENVVPFEAPEGKVTANLYMSTIDDVVWLIGCNDYEKERTLDEARDDSVKGVQGKLLSEKKVTVGGRKGRALEIEGPGGSRIHVRLFVVKTRLHQALVVLPPATKVPPKQVKKFLTSFKLPRGR